MLCIQFVSLMVGEEGHRKALKGLGYNSSSWSGTASL